MLSPPVNREIGDLAPAFRIPFLAWLAAAESVLTHVEFRVTETRRTRERQAWLYAQGREEPHLGAPRVTWTMDSKHRWGLAVDIAMIRRSTGQAIWEISSWQHLYQAVPLEPYGLTTLAPLEYVHIEHLLSDELIERADAVHLVHT
ncbi:MAG: hypothetical protein WDA03_08360 [Trueperaceae bacterium]